mgnify:FL=1
MTVSSPRRYLLVVLAAVFILRCISEYRVSLEVWPRVRALGYESYFEDVQPGLVPCVEWIRAQGTVRIVYGPEYAADHYLYQRLSEMLYPIAFRPLAGRTLKVGDIVVLPGNRTVMRAEGTIFHVFQSDNLQILRVEP